MVKHLSRADKNNIAAAIAESERHTSAELAVVIAPASDPYQSFMLLYGLFLGSMVDLGLWEENIVPDFPILLAIQIAAISLLTFAPWLRHLCLRCVPMHIRHHRAGKRAYEEYLIVSRHVSSSVPIVLLYISLAEHYAHILQSRQVREKISDEHWQAIIRELTSSVASTGLAGACIKAVQHSAELLALNFPEQGQPHEHVRHIIEVVEQES